MAEKNHDREVLPMEESPFSGVAHAILYSSDMARSQELGRLIKGIGATVDVVSDMGRAQELVLENGHDLLFSDVSGFDPHGINMLNWFNHQTLKSRIKSLGIITAAASLIPKFTYRVNYDNKFSAGDTTFDNMVSVLFSLYASASPISWLKKAADAMRAGKDEIREGVSGRNVVLLLGETGVGKDAFAQIAHETGARREHRFVFVDCQLHGDVPFLPLSDSPGSKREIERNIQGIMAEADGGTLYFHEVARLPVGVQRILAKVLASNSFTEPGTGRKRRFTGVVILSANDDIGKATVKGNFSVELYEAISAITLRIPSLAECRQDIVPLAEAFLSQYCVKESLPQMSLSTESRKKLTGHVWTGNVRELYSVMTRAALQSDRKKIQPSDINLLDLSDDSERPASKRARVRKALRDARGKKAKAARALGITRKTLYRWMAELDIPLDYPHTGTLKHSDNDKD